MRIFLDACIIIYWVEAAAPFYTQVISSLRKIAESYPDHLLTISRLSFLECLVQPLRNQDKKIMAVYRQFFELPSVSIIEIDPHVIDIATRLRANYNLRTPDAIQAACCLSTEGEHLFLTNDNRFSIISDLQVRLLFETN